MSPAQNAANTPRKFGTFGGVFTPSILTILSAILFIRANFVVGEAGVGGALAILLLANLIALFSALSVCAVSTNMQVRGGGAYFLISRVLGPEFGGAIGIIFFFALALNVAFNILGFTEALFSTVPGLPSGYFLPIALTAATVLFAISFVGAQWSIKTQYFIMAFLVLSIAVMWGGAALLFSGEQFQANLGAGYTPLFGTTDLLTRHSFWLVFAIFFPSVTGFLAGVNMSGDLKNPMKNIPQGTLYAVGVGALVYLTTMLLGAGAFAREDLIQRPFDVLKDNALFGLGFLVAAGVFAATLSTALGSYLGAPRVLQAVARDRLVPWLQPFAAGTRNGDEPRRALWLTFVLAIGVLVWAGTAGGGNAFNIVAGVISMVFLATYGMLNLAAFTEGFSNNPSFRPRFRAFHWITAMLGFLGCAAVALLIDAWPALIAAAVIGLLWWYLRRRELHVAFGDVRRGYAYRQARNYLLQLRGLPEDGRNWRPTILAFAGSPTKREKLVSFAVWLEAGRGFVQLVQILPGDPARDRELHMRAERQLYAFLDKNDLHAFPVTAVSHDVSTGIQLVLQTAAIGPVHPNLALFGWNSGSSTTGDYIDYLRNAETTGMSIAIVSGDELPQAPGRRRVDVWWRGRKNGPLMLLLAHLLTRNWEWAHAHIRLLRVVSEEEGRQPALAALKQLVVDARVDAEPEVICRPQPFPEILREYSRDSDCVFLGFEIPTDEQAAEWQANYERFFAGMPTTILINSRGMPDLLV